MEMPNICWQSQVSCIAGRRLTGGLIPAYLFLAPRNDFQVTRKPYLAFCHSSSCLSYDFMLLVWSPQVGVVSKNVGLWSADHLVTFCGWMLEIYSLMGQRWKEDLVFRVFLLLLFSVARISSEFHTLRKKALWYMYQSVFCWSPPSPELRLKLKNWSY